jgi:hypothetical protein
MKSKKKTSRTNMPPKRRRARDFVTAENQADPEGANRDAHNGRRDAVAVPWHIRVSACTTAPPQLRSPTRGDCESGLTQKMQEEERELKNLAL